VPGSHRVWGFAASKKHDTPHPDERLVTMPAGSVLVFNGHLWHSGTRNRSTANRDALQLSFSRRGSVPGEPPAVRNATLDRLGPAALLLL
jgi:ectoine hydroxylase-related dioxygenase (phytanoyl-CoA dioxygenase family)